MKTSWIVGIALSSAVAFGIGYAIHFDYKRRNDAAFRRKLRRDKKKLSRAQKVEAQHQEEILAQAIRKAYHEVQRCTLPHLVEEREQFFMQEVAKGEGLYAQGSHKFIEAASCFFRALKVYPNQMELMVIYEKTIPKEVNAIIVKLLQLDESANASKNIEETLE
ncbi:hypothetical protein T552_00571 [Pneumocystis carinii B80]|uniref:Protein import receptor MAS20 n=1 Tax=Pneumocystis carinii (strain B80) TaxID=1408658 RepID=A0A0W4ZR59_PNEC8|nr:hypothetical protein T552_00571 [Pneumocystis carinii B80]KTW30860.1 hypothetical protein T552_00571 [Pneumocystis carinii B80]